MPKVPLKTAKQEKESGSQAPTLAHKRPQCGRFVMSQQGSLTPCKQPCWGRNTRKPSDDKENTGVGDPNEQDLLCSKQRKPPANQPAGGKKSMT